MVSPEQTSFSPAAQSFSLAAATFTADHYAGVASGSTATSPHTAIAVVAAGGRGSGGGGEEWGDVTDDVTAGADDVTLLGLGLSAVRESGVVSTLLSRVGGGGWSSDGQQQGSQDSVGHSVTPYYLSDPLLQAGGGAVGGGGGGASTNFGEQFRDSSIISSSSSSSSIISSSSSSVGGIGSSSSNLSWLYVENVTSTSSPPPYLVSTTTYDNLTNVTELGVYELKHPAIGIMLALFSFVVIVGNVMVIVAVFKELYLRSVTNYFIVSLAIADVMVGGVVMPFAISHEMTQAVWLYGQEWCDLWHSLDVLASTASILNLCVISLDRYWAITDPINYPSRMSNSKVCLLIALVWLCSAGISFPAIAWWKAVTPSDLPEHECQFTEDSGYLIISSLISFYIPAFIMMFVYAKIYLAAMRQSEGIKSGSKITTNGLRGEDGELMTLRIHRGGLRSHEEQHHHHHQHTNGGEGSSSGGIGGGATHIQYDRSTSDSDQESPCHSTRVHISESSNSGVGGTPARPAKHITKRLRHFALSKKLTKLAREQKAAKTLGIVVGVFIMCWLPFFVTNLLIGLCKETCVTNPDILFPVVSWLGYINSGMNPIIYALSMRDFRRAFSKMIFCCCPRYRYQQRQRTYHYHNSMSTSSFSAACGDKCVALKM